MLTLNGSPFAKRALKNGDLLQIGETVIQFEGRSTEPHEHWVETREQLQEVVEKAMAGKQKSGSSFNIISTPEDYEQGTLEPDVEVLLRQLEESAEEPREEVPQQRASLKDSYLSDFDDEEEEKKEVPKPNSTLQEVMQWNWRLIATGLSALLLLGLFIILFFYYSLSNKNRNVEIKAAEAVADISMALTYAQFNHFQPPNLNWTDPEFLKNNMIAVLASQYSPLSSLDLQGLFNNSNYILRVYNSGDLSQYVIIAQPAPSLSQWILPRAAIVVDSKAMELRKITDMRVLNRLLLNPNPLDGAGANEVSRVYQTGASDADGRISRKNAQAGL